MPGKFADGNNKLQPINKLLCQYTTSARWLATQNGVQRFMQVWTIALPRTINCGATGQAAVQRQGRQVKSTPML
jgi:hypothetical protein